MLTASHDSESSSEDALLSDALCRGASYPELLTLAKTYETQHPGSLSAAVVLGLNAVIPVGPDLIDLRRKYKVEGAMRAYQGEISHEFASLDPDIQRCFWEGDKSKQKDRSYPLRYYSALRPSYYNYGYNLPCKTIFSQIVKTKFIGKDIHVHNVAVEPLRRTEAALRRLDPDIVTSLSASIKLLGGFVPRFIAPRQGIPDPHILSNHAFGLAIDIDWDSNPHIKDRDVIRVIKEITGFDFAQLLVPECGTEETYRLAVAASRRLQAWLRQYVPLRDSVMADLGGAHGRSEEDRASQLLFRSATSNHSESPSDDTAAELARLNVLYKFHGRMAVQIWMSRGILSLPPFLIKALIDQGFEWGGQYEHTKDFMHFELGHWNPRNVLKPDSDQRSLGALFGNPQASAAKSHTHNKRTKHLP